MDELTEHDRITRLIYEAALEPERWREALIELAQWLEVDVFHLVGWDTKTQTDSIGIVPDPHWQTALIKYQTTMRT